MHLAYSAAMQQQMGNFQQHAAMQMPMDGGDWCDFLCPPLLCSTSIQCVLLLYNAVRTCTYRLPLTHKRIYIHKGPHIHTHRHTHAHTDTYTLHKHIHIQKHLLSPPQKISRHNHTICEKVMQCPPNFAGQAPVAQITEAAAEFTMVATGLQ